jgi:hypothetical protein
VDGVEVVGQVWPAAGPGGLAVQVPGTVTTTPGRFWHKIRVETPDGQRRTVAYGPLLVVDA